MGTSPRDTTVSVFGPRYLHSTRALLPKAPRPSGTSLEWRRGRDLWVPQTAYRAQALWRKPLLNVSDVKDVPAHKELCTSRCCRFGKTTLAEWLKAYGTWRAAHISLIPRHARQLLLRRAEIAKLVFEFGAKARFGGVGAQLPRHEAQDAGTQQNPPIRIEVTSPSPCSTNRLSCSEVKFTSINFFRAFGCFQHESEIS